MPDRNSKPKLYEEEEMPRVIEWRRGKIYLESREKLKGSPWHDEEARCSDLFRTSGFEPPPEPKWYRIPRMLGTAILWMALLACLFATLMLAFMVLEVIKP